MVSSAREVAQIAWNSRFGKQKQGFFTESIVILLMALAQASEDARSLHGFKRNQINPQKKNPLRDVEHKDAVFGSENIAAHRVLEARGTLLHACPHLHASLASLGHCQRQDVELNSSWVGPTIIFMCLCLLSFCHSLETLLLLRCWSSCKRWGQREDIHSQQHAFPCFSHSKSSLKG